MVQTVHEAFAAFFPAERPEQQRPWASKHPANYDRQANLKLQCTVNPNQWGVTSGDGNLCMNVSISPSLPVRLTLHEDHDG